MTDYLTTPEGTIGYSDTGGDGPLVVAAPGMGDVREVYRYLTPLVHDAGYRVVTFDLRGAGDSSVDWPSYTDRSIARDMIALIRHLDAGSATVVGNSLSAGSAVIAANEEPDLVNGLILIGPFVRDVPSPGWQKLGFKVFLMPPWGRRAWTTYYRKNMYPLSAPHDHEEYVSALGSKLGEPGRFRAFRALAFNSHVDSDVVLDDITQPVLVVMGTADPDFAEPAGEAELIARRTGATVHLVDGAGHYPQAEAPDEVAPVAIAFLKSLRVT